MEDVGSIGGVEPEEFPIDESDFEDTGGELASEFPPAIVVVHVKVNRVKVFRQSPKDIKVAFKVSKALVQVHLDNHLIDLLQIA